MGKALDERITEIAGGVTYEESETVVETTEDVATAAGYIATNQGVGEVCPMTFTATNLNQNAVVNMVAGQKLEIIGVGGNSSRLWAILDKDTHVIQSVADANSSTPAAPFEKTIVAETDCIVVVNVYNANGVPPYGNSNNTPYSIKLTTYTTETVPVPVVTDGILAGMQDDIEDNAAAIEDIQENVAEVRESLKDKAFEMTTAMPATAAAFNALWDKFVTDGLAVRTTIASPNNKPVYQYHIAPYNKIATNPNNTAAFTIADNNYFSKKKILVLAGLHGNEKQTPLWVYEFFNRILYNDDYAAYRSAFDWYVVPLVNPTGYDANTRNNYNDVNINRDFARKTQAETQALCSLIDNGDFDFLIDAHQLSGGSGNSSTSPLVCGAFIPCVNMTDATLTDLCTRYTKGGAKADAALCKYFNKEFMQTTYVWPSYQAAQGDLQSHEYAFQKGVINSCSFEFTQYAYVYSGSNTIYNDGSMVYGNTVFHYLMMEFLS